MKRTVLLLTVLLAVVADLLMPQRVWVRQSCCHTQLSLVAPGAGSDCAMSGQVDALALERDAEWAPLSCCSTTEFTLRPEAAQATPLPDFDASVVSASPATAFFPLQPVAFVRIENRLPARGWWLHGDPPSTRSLLPLHTRLNL